MDTKDEFFEEEARIEKMIHVASAVCDEDAYPDMFEEFVEAFPDYRSSHSLFTDLPFLKNFLADGNYPEPEEVARALNDRDVRGLLVQGATTVYRPEGDGIISSSWGWYRMKWFYAESINDAERKVLDWAKDQHKRDMEKKAS